MTKIAAPADRKPLVAMPQALSPGEVREDAPQGTENPEWVENLNVRLICKDCREDPPDLHEDHQSGDMICGSCGLVLQQRSVDQSSEWRTFNNDEQGNDDPSRVGDGPNALLNGAQLETQISFGDGGLRNKELHRAQNKSTYDKSNKSLLSAYKVIGNLCDSFSMAGNVADSAKHLYKDAEESKYFKGKSVLAMAASCVFLASRVNGSERSFREVMEKTKLSKKEIGRTFKQLEQFTQKKHAEKRRQNDAGSNIPGAGKLIAVLTLSFPFPSLICFDSRSPYQLRAPAHYPKLPRPPRRTLLQRTRLRCQSWSCRPRSRRSNGAFRFSGRPLPSLVCCRLHLHDGPADERPTLVERNRRSGQS